MEKFTVHTGVAAPLIRNNIDTDAIIPSREMRRVSKEGLGEGLFAGWRYTLPGGREPNPDFVLNDKAYRNTSILLAGDNFGCGSSREHAVWALQEYGIRAILAPSFGSIFFNNCICNGILPIAASAADIQALVNSVRADPQRAPLTIDLPAQTVCAGGSRQLAFSLDKASKAMLLEGLDSIALTLQQADRIDEFEQQDRSNRPWIYL